MPLKKISEYPVLLPVDVVGDEMLLLADTTPASNYRMTLDSLSAYLSETFLAESGDTVVNIRETEQAVTTGSIDAALGAIVTMTLSANATLALSNFDAGMSMVVHIVNGDTYSVDWATAGVVWHGAVPVLGATHTVVFEKRGTTLYGYDARETV